MNQKKFAEALMFQCMEDLYNPRYMQQSIDFFTGEGFQLLATMAEMSPSDRYTLMKMVRKQIAKTGLRILRSVSENVEHPKVLAASTC